MVVIVVAGSGGGEKGGEPSNLSDVGEVDKLLSGIPQNATVLGKPGAPVKMFEYGDLQCPFCKENAETVTPPIIEEAVRKGEVSLTFRNFIIIGPDSVPAGEAALAAGAQGKAWNFIELWYRNQGEENSGYVTEEFIESIGKGAGIPNLAQWNKERKSKKYKKTLEETTKQAQKSASKARRRSRSKARTPKASNSSARPNPPGAARRSDRKSELVAPREGTAPRRPGAWP